MNQDQLFKVREALTTLLEVIEDELGIDTDREEAVKEPAKKAAKAPKAPKASKANKATPAKKAAKALKAEPKPEPKGRDVVSLKDAQALLTLYISQNGPDEVIKAFNSVGVEKLSDLNVGQRAKLVENIKTQIAESS